MIEFIKDHLWQTIAVIFSGIGTSFLIKSKHDKTVNQKQTSGNNSINIQAGRDVKTERISNE